MMTSSNINIFRVTAHLCGELTGHRWIPLTKASDTEIWCFLVYAWTNDWINNYDAGDLRRHHTHYDVIVIDSLCFVVAWYPAIGQYLTGLLQYELLWFNAKGKYTMSSKNSNFVSEYSPTQMLLHYQNIPKTLLLNVLIGLTGTGIQQHGVYCIVILSSWKVYGAIGFLLSQISWNETRTSKRKVSHCWSITVQNISGILSLLWINDGYIILNNVTDKYFPCNMVFLLKSERCFIINDVVTRARNSW